MKYLVKIIETLAMDVEIEASSAEEAINQVAKLYRDETIVVESNARPDVEFFASLTE